MLTSLLSALLLLPAAGPAAGDVCQVEARKVTWQALPVPTHGGSVLKLSVFKWPMVVTVKAGKEDASVLVIGPVAFEGKVKLADLPLRPKSGTKVADGVVKLGKATVLLEPRPTGQEVRATASLGAGVTVPGVNIPCDRLVIDPEPGAWAEPVPKNPTSGGVKAKDKHLTLKSSATAEGGQSIVFAEGSSLVFKGGKPKEGWVKVSAKFDDRAALSGYAPEGQLTPAPEGGVAAPVRKGPTPCVPGAAPNTRVAYIPAGVHIHGKPDSISWGVAMKKLTASVVDSTGPWVQVREIAGISEGCKWLDNAWVRSSLIKFK